MFASLVSDAMMGLGCVTFSFAVMAFAAFLVALHCGLLPGLAERLKRFRAAPPPKEDEGRPYREV